MSDPQHKGEVLGFRQWTLDGHQLKSSVHHLGATWRLGENKAECRRKQFDRGSFAVRSAWVSTYGTSGPTEPKPRTYEPHDAPAKNCMCGYYAYHDASKLGWGEEQQVYGAVRAWGRIEVHVDGFRAEYAEPIALAYTESQPYGHVVKVMALAGEFGVPCVPLEKLAETAQAIAAPVPADLRPEKPPKSSVEEVYLQQIQAYNKSLAMSSRHWSGSFSWAHTDPAEYRKTLNARAARDARTWVYGCAPGAFLNAGLFGFFHGPVNAGIALVFGTAAGIQGIRARRLRKRAET